MKKLSVFILGMGLLLSACTSPEDRLVEKKIRLRALEDSLFADYGGSEWANRANINARSTNAQASDDLASSVANALGSVIGNAANDLDRDLFVSNCLLLGQGERPQVLSAQARKYFGQSSTLQRCLELAQRTADVARMEAELGGASGMGR